MIVAANFKTNMTRKTTAKYLEALESFIAQNEITQQVMVFPPLTALDSFSGKVSVGAQNAYPVEKGAFTGEVALEQLNEFGTDTILIGHSERRHVIGESQASIAEKFAFFKEQGFTIVYCIGEPLEVREEGNEALMDYLDAQLVGIDLSYEKLVIAYEPVWAIGTGLTPSNSDVELIHGALREKITKPLLYGGSVKANNAGEIMALNNVDGVLVGGASLYIEHFCKMIEDAQNLNKEGEK
ncbi:MAG: triose-phosphate isomerase [Campylobacterota bacterium]|nr:triose-phosphate isomerase [Campylobacterota bacterium]